VVHEELLALLNLELLTLNFYNCVHLILFVNRVFSVRRCTSVHT
jgi:hypothetical protein